MPERAGNSRDRLRALAVENGWTVTAEWSGQHDARDRHGRQRPRGVKVDVWTLRMEKPIDGGDEVRAIVYWKNGRFTEATVGITTSRVMGIVNRMAALRTIVTDPNAGYVKATA